MTTHPAFDLAIAHALVRRASTGELRSFRRISVPTSPAVAFGRRDTRLPGFARAVEAVREAGFEPVVRATGGRAVAYTGASVVVDEVRADPNPTEGHDARFITFGSDFVGLFRGLGVDARLGPVPGEYCPGAHSVNARGTAKLVGTAQRVVRGAWLFSSLVVVDDADVIRPVLDDVYRCLDQPFDPASVGSLADEVPGLTVDDVRRALGASDDLDDPTIALAGRLVADHRVDLGTS